MIGARSGTAVLLSLARLISAKLPLSMNSVRERVPALHGVVPRCPAQVALIVQEIDGERLHDPLPDIREQLRLVLDRIFQQLDRIRRVDAVGVEEMVRRRMVVLPYAGRDERGDAHRLRQDDGDARALE